MNLGDITIGQILLTAFSGFGITIIGWIINKFCKKIKSKTHVIQKGNTVKGNMAAGTITTKQELIEKNQGSDNIKVKQENNNVDGDLSARNIIR